MVIGLVLFGLSLGLFVNVSVCSLCLLLTRCLLLFGRWVLCFFGGFWACCFRFLSFCCVGVGVMLFSCGLLDCCMVCMHICSTDAITHSLLLLWFIVFDECVVFGGLLGCL